MKITLRKIGKSPQNFESARDSVTLKGTLEFDPSLKLIALHADLHGMVETECAVCGEDFDLEVDEHLDLFISDGVFIDENNSMIDVVETSNGELDVDELIASEIELIKSDYHCCEFCEMGED